MRKRKYLADLVSAHGAPEGYQTHGLKSGMHNIRLAGQTWPAEAFNLAREKPSFASFFDKNTL